MKQKLSNKIPAFKTIVALAKADGKDGKIEIKSKHIKEVVSLSKKFKDYMKEVNRNQSASKVARRDGWRAENEDDENDEDQSKISGLLLK